MTTASARVDWAVWWRGQTSCSAASGPYSAAFTTSTAGTNRALSDTSTPATRSTVNHSAPDHTVIAMSAAKAAPSRPNGGTSSRLATTSVAIAIATAGRLV